MANSQLAQQIADNQQLAAQTQQALRSNNRRVIRRANTDPETSNHGGDFDDHLPEVEIETEDRRDLPITVEAAAIINKKSVALTNQVQTASPSSVTKILAPKVSSSNVVSLPNTSITVSPLDLPTEHFSAGLYRRKQNRQLLMEWLRTSLVNGIDYGSIHVVGRDRCQLTQMGRMNECKESSHWSKSVLFKAGAEKISGMLGMTVNFPSLPDYEAAVFGQVPITVIIMRCELRDAHGHVVAEGVGARNLSQDYGDINKSFKMVEKSAHIDATLRLAGLSEMFTQDLDDMPPPGSGSVSVSGFKPGGEEPAFSSSMPKNQPAAVSPPSSTSSPTARRVVIQPKPKINLKLKPNPTVAAKLDQEAEVALLASRADLMALHKAITKHGFTERRVLSWVTKFTHGAVTKLEQLPAELCASLLKRLEHWAEAEFFQSSAAKGNFEQGA